MTRRRLIEWLARVIGATCAAVVAVPAVRYLIDPLRKRAASGRGFKRVARLDGLPVGLPREFPVRDLQRDAWTLYPEETVGRVWIVRKTATTVAPAETQLDVYSSVCPHLGCAIQLDPAKKNFVCPCHKGVFAFDGKRLSDQEIGRKNPTPRGLDPLEWRIVEDKESEKWWVEIRYQKFRQGLTGRVALG